MYEFNSTSLGDNWSVVHDAESRWTVADGALNIGTHSSAHRAIQLVQ